MNTTPATFLVWCNNKKEFEQDEVIISQNGNLFQAKDLRPLKSDTHFVMQLTALRSINDDPIYNHMIVKDNFDNHYVVDMFDYELMKWLDDHSLTIVGNRFQHPELLELYK